jgi:hypothetical protein
MRCAAALYQPVLGSKEERGRVVDLVVAILLDGQADVGS